MPIKRSEAQTHTVTISVPFFDDTLNLEVVPAKLSWSRVMKAQQEMEKAKSEQAKAKFAIAQIIMVADSWDYLDDDGVPLKVTEEYLTELPIGVVNQIFEQFGELLKIPKATETESISLS
jgi:hypothetical protein